MSILWITEYENMVTDFEGRVVFAGQEPALCMQRVFYTCSTTSFVLHERTRLVRLIADGEAHVCIGEDGAIADATCTPLEPNKKEFFGIRQDGEPLVIAVYDGRS